MKMLNFNELNRPTLPLCMCDDAKTVVTVTTPTEILVEELEATLPELQGIMAGKDEKAIETCYDLAARLISCNREGLAVSVDDLRGKYWPADRITNMLHLVTFFGAYMDFIKEINNEKN
jgi:hypothetical protein